MKIIAEKLCLHLDLQEGIGINMYFYDGDMKWDFVWYIDADNPVRQIKMMFNGDVMPRNGAWDLHEVFNYVQSGLWRMVDKEFFNSRKIPKDKLLTTKDIIVIDDESYRLVRLDDNKFTLIRTEDYTVWSYKTIIGDYTGVKESEIKKLVQDYTIINMERV